MRFNGGEALPWSRVERILSGRPGPVPVSVDHLPQAADAPKVGHSAVPFAELHAVSSYSFLHGASEPEELVARAVELGLWGIALVDRDGFYGLMKFVEAAAQVGLPAVFGAELSLDPAPLTVLARTPEGYRRLSRLISRARMEAGEKGVVSYPSLAEIGAQLQDECLFLVGWEWAEHFDLLVDGIKIDSMVLEYACTQLPEDADHHLLLDSLPVPRAIATARPAAAAREHARLAGAKQALSRRLALADASPNSHPMGSSWLRSGEQMARLLPERPELIAETVRVLEECSFTWEALAPNLPDFDVPEGHTEMSWLEHLTFERRGSALCHAPRGDSAQGVGADAVRAGRRQAAGLSRLLPHRVRSRGLL